jgi:hypothetical protein
MKVRFKVGSLQDLIAPRSKPRKLAVLLAALMTPASAAAYALGLWRLGADLDITGRFAISKGLFSHWQVWIASGAAIQAAAMTLSRYGHAEDEERNTAADQRPAA